MLSLKEVLIQGKKYLRANAFEASQTPALDAELLLMHTVNVRRTELVTKDERALSEEEISRYFAALEKRAGGMPVQYLTGQAEFMSLPFLVNENVLIPRGDTEILTEYLIEEIQRRGFSEIIEIGTGSGCIAVSLANYCAAVHITAADISSGALSVARENARINGVADRIDFLESDLFSAVPKTLLGQADVIVSNPPYIRTGEIDGLFCNVKDYEPLTALDGGADGLYFYEKITEAAAAFLRVGGLLIFEIGFDQKEAVGQRMTQRGFTGVGCKKDLAGHDRVIYSYQNKEWKQ
ncbi:MAG: peptide chain release factor N(5)-glutamine methyltransferase [Clostridiales bacterium]|jgi:release factor glutamine methyltransferase|nr:peptide chain release factor N(5)-glutamine methyltransferase [Clostridiales bacterium]